MKQLNPKQFFAKTTIKNANKARPEMAIHQMILLGMKAKRATWSMDILSNSNLNPFQKMLVLAR
jgi:hypothetical protein